jgi:hypothetical protein
MHVIQGDLWSELGKADLVLVTANSYITRDDRLTMGCGAALEMKERFPGIDKLFGEMLRRAGLHLDKYGVAVVSHGGSPIAPLGTDLGLFQVKQHFMDQAQLDLISSSCHDLRVIAGDYRRIAMNFPGIGAGRLSRENVEPFLRKYLGDLDNLYIYYK